MDKSDYASIFGARLKATRKKTSVTQDTLAKAAGIAKDTLSRYERGNISPSAEAAVKIAEALNVSASWLLTGSDKERHIEQDVNDGSIRSLDIHLNDVGEILGIITKGEKINFRYMLSARNIAYVLDGFRNKIESEGGIDENILSNYLIVIDHLSNFSINATIDSNNFNQGVIFSSRQYDDDGSVWDYSGDGFLEAVKEKI